VTTLSTGLSLRDEHMRRYIFTPDDGQLPDVRFIAGKTRCSAEVSGRSACKVVGELSVRGTTRPFVFSLKLKRDGNAFHADGEGALKLSTYGIPQPSQFGVKSLDDVKLEIAFTARRRAATASGTRTW
jgi:polyisoprenoid-binding protein YceI